MFRSALPFSSSKVLVDTYNQQLFACVESCFDVLAAILYLAAADVFALHGLNLQLSDLRFGFVSSYGLDDINTHVEAHKGTLAAAQIDIDLLLFVLLSGGTFDDIGL